ncbi:MAG: DNA mismatch endonuclease Vsr [Alphaproteobacteria bacterium]|nr:DNA mismatch endonuclease Vsr [Alphaproteobacteria bacterium]
MDKLTKEQRHHCMSAIKGKNTKPEILVRKFLFARGFRYRLNHPRLPGHPDIVLRKYKTCIFVNGCFWHKHEGCKYFVVPKTRTEFWLNKINRNQERDKEVKKQLAKMGWHSITIWECELKPSKKDKTLESLLYTLNKIFLLNYRVNPYKIVEKEMFMKVAENSDVEYRKITEK